MVCYEIINWYSCMQRQETSSKFGITCEMKFSCVPSTTPSCAIYVQYIYVIVTYNMQLAAVLHTCVGNWGCAKGPDWISAHTPQTWKALLNPRCTCACAVTSSGYAHAWTDTLSMELYFSIWGSLWLQNRPHNCNHVPVVTVALYLVLQTNALYINILTWTSHNKFLSVYRHSPDS